MRNILKYVLFLFALVPGLYLKGQVNTDSLTNIINKGGDDDNTVNACYILSAEIMYTNPDEAIMYAKKGVETAQKINFKSGEAYCLYDLGLCLMDSENFEKATECFEKALDISLELNNENVAYSCLDGLGSIEVFLGNYEKAMEYFNKAFVLTKQSSDTINMTLAYKNIAATYFYQGKYGKAIEYFEKAIQLCESEKDKSNMASCLIGIGCIHAKQKNFKEAESFLNEALTINRETGDSALIAVTLNNLATVYNDQAKYDDALNVYIESLELYKRFGAKKDEANCLSNIANVYYNQKKFALAIEYYKNALAIAEPLNLMREVAYAMSGLGYAYMMIENFEMAVYYANQSLDVAEGMNDYENMKYSTEVLYRTYAKLNDFMNAYNYHVDYKGICDSLYNIETRRIVDEMEAKYQNEKKQKEIIQLNEESKIQKLQLEREQNLKKMQQYVFIISIIIVLLTSLIMYLRYKNKKNISIAQMQKNHFTEVIEAEDQERKRIAADLHDSIGVMLATAKLNLTELKDSVVFKTDEDEDILQNALDIIDETSKDVRMISHSMMPGVLRELGVFFAVKDLLSKINTSHKINAELITDCDKDCFDETTQIAIYKIIQEILSNIIKHANASRINIEFTNKSQYIELTIIDNGIGINTSNIDKSDGIGWQNIYSRIAMLNAKIEILSNKHKGSKIKIIIPVTKNKN